MGYNCLMEGIENMSKSQIRFIILKLKIPKILKYLCRPLLRPRDISYNPERARYFYLREGVNVLWIGRSWAFHLGVGDGFHRWASCLGRVAKTWPPCHGGGWGWRLFCLTGSSRAVRGRRWKHGGKIEQKWERERWLEWGGLEDDELGNVFGKNSSIEVKRPKQREIRKKWVHNKEGE